MGSATPFQSETVSTKGLPRAKGLVRQPERKTVAVAW